MARQFDHLGTECVSIQSVALLLDFYIYIHLIMTTKRDIFHATPQDSQDHAAACAIADAASGDGLLLQEPNNNTDHQQQQLQQERQRKDARCNY
jgi:hypothetical protein